VDFEILARVATLQARVFLTCIKSLEVVMKLFDLKGQIAFVTGAGSGIGQRLAVGLAEAGSDVACFDLPGSRELNLTIERIEALGRRAVKHEGDVTKASDLQEAVSKLEQGLGPLSIALNCAGIANAAPAEEMSLEQWQQMLDVNLTGVFLACQAEAQVMLPRKRGAIIRKYCQ
jgi:NAD(P)-dependent dehydrogenase (short-subunit alcohol dehydrogenase family)